MQLLSTERAEQVVLSYIIFPKNNFLEIIRTDTRPHVSMLHICLSLGRYLIIAFKYFTHALADKLKLPPVELKLDILLD